MKCTALLFCLAATVVAVKAASVSGQASIDKASAAIGGRIVFPRLPGINAPIFGGILPGLFGGPRAGRRPPPPSILPGLFPGRPGKPGRPGRPSPPGGFPNGIPPLPGLPNGNRTNDSPIEAPNGNRTSSNDSPIEAPNGNRTSSNDSPIEAPNGNRTSSDNSPIEAPNGNRTSSNDATSESPINDSTSESPNDSTSESPNDSTSESPNDSSSESPNDSTSESPNDSSSESPNDSSSESPSESPDDASSTESSTDSSTNSPDDDGVAIPEVEAKPLTNLANLFDIPDPNSLIPDIPSSAGNLSGVDVPAIPGLPDLSQLPKIPGLSSAIETAREHVQAALGVGTDVASGVQEAMQRAFDDEDPAGAIRAIVRTIIDAYLTVAANCPLMVVGSRVIQEGIRLALEVAASARNVIFGTTSAPPV